MNKNELITNQRLEIETLKQEKKQLINDREAVFLVLFNVGGALNCSPLNYTKEQLMPFFEIRDILGL